MRLQAARLRVIAFLDRRAVRDGLIVAGVALLAAQLWLALNGNGEDGFDARTYWEATRVDDPYTALLAGAFDGYKYPPPLAQLLWPIRFLPWPVFWPIWTGLLFGTYLVLAGRWAFPVLLLWPPILGEFWLGNINLFLALAILLATRWPALWAPVLLTKLTPGVGLLWYVVRREWRHLAVALAATAAIAGISLFLAPNLWREYLDVARAQLAVAETGHPREIPITLPVRVVIAAVIVVAGARSNRAWTIPLAAAVATPFAWWWTVGGLAVAAIPLASPASAPVAARLAGLPVPDARPASPGRKAARDSSLGGGS